MEAVGALATIALAIVGLAGVFSNTMAAIATIVIGASVLSEAGAFGATMFTRVGASAVTTTEASNNGGLSADLLGGIAGIVLGILALLGVAQVTLLAVAVLIFGATFLLSSLAFANTNFNSGGQLLVGLAGIVLGILAVIGLDQMTLVLVGLLSLGVAALFSGSSWGVRALAYSQQ